MKHLLKTALVGCLLLSFAQGAIAQRQLCQSGTTMLWAGTPYENSITIRHDEVKTFRTNVVCGATSYTWTVGGEASMTTTSPSVSLKGRDLVWLPAGGCDDFNNDWTPYNPLNIPPYNGGFGSVRLGDYATTLSVRSNVSSAVTLPVVVQNVEECRDSSGGGFGF